MYNMDGGIGNKIKEYRLSIKMTQSEFAERLGVTGSAVSAYENGIRQPSFTVLTKMAAILGVTTDHLLGISSNDEKKINVSGLTNEQFLMINSIVDAFETYNKISAYIEKSQ